MEGNDDCLAGHLSQSQLGREEIQQEPLTSGTITTVVHNSVLPGTTFVTRNQDPPMFFSTANIPGEMHDFPHVVDFVYVSSRQRSNPEEESSETIPHKVGVPSNGLFFGAGLS